ncbi:MAG: hypothetical protein JJ863_26960 [Deltaproteobacteria bacterium]|nr:hypothetical protein [Deltaproteobacteria bacterium]
MAPSKTRAIEGLTLVETAIVVCVVGSVLAIFVPTFLDHLRTSKVEEPPLLLDELFERTKTYYEQRQGEERWCLPGQAGPAPADTSQDPAPHDFTGSGAPGRETFEAIGFETERPIRYRYELIPRRAGCGVDLEPGHILFTVRATGDLDGDGVESTYERRATVDDDGRVIPSGILYVDHPIE